MAELADAPDLGSGDANRGGSSPSKRMVDKQKQLLYINNVDWKHNAPMVKSVNTGDLKSPAQKACRFDSDSEHTHR